MTPTRIAVVGAGAIGQLYGGLLAAAGHAVGLLARADAGRLAAQGLRLDLAPCADLAASRQRHWQVAPACVATTAAELAAAGPWPWVLIAAKATALGGLLDGIAAIAAPGARVVLAANGLGGEERLARHLPGRRILGLLCFVCANRADDRVVHLAHGRTAAGHHGDDPRERDALAELMAGSGIRCDAPASLAEARWRKLAWNIPFNGLAIRDGAPGRTVDRILADPALHALALALAREAIAAGNADLGRPGIAADWAEEQLARSAEMGPYAPSTLLDLRAGAALEIDAIWGEPLRRAQRLGVAAPELAGLHRALARLPGAG